MGLQCHIFHLFLKRSQYCKTDERRRKYGDRKKVENGKGRKYDKIHSWYFKIIVSVQKKLKYKNVHDYKWFLESD